MGLDGFFEFSRTLAYIRFLRSQVRATCAKETGKKGEPGPQSREITSWHFRLPGTMSPAGSIVAENPGASRKAELSVSSREKQTRSNVLHRRRFFDEIETVSRSLSSFPV